MLRLKDILGATAEWALKDELDNKIINTYFNSAKLTNVNTLTLYTPGNDSEIITIPYAKQDSTSGEYTGGLISTDTQKFTGIKYFNSPIITSNGIRVSQRTVSVGSQNNKYLLMGIITLKSTYANSPITFEFHRRQDLTTTTCFIRFSNTGDKTTAVPTIRCIGTAIDAVYLVRSSTASDLSKWYLYIRSDQTYDTISITRLQKSTQIESKMDIEWISSEIKEVTTNDLNILTAEELQTSYDTRYKSDLIPLARTVGTSTIEYKAHSENGGDSTSNYFSIPSATETEAGLVSTGHQRFSGCKVFDNDIVFNTLGTNTRALVFANKASKASDITPYASWRIAYHAEGQGEGNRLSFETGQVITESNAAWEPSIMDLHPVTSSSVANKIVMRANLTITNNFNPRIYFISTVSSQTNHMQHWIGSNASNQYFGIYDSNSSYYLFRNYRYEDDSNSTKRLGKGVAMEDSLHIVGTSSTEVDRGIFVRNSSSFNASKQREIALYIDKNGKQGLLIPNSSNPTTTDTTTPGTWLLYYNPEVSTTTLRSENFNLYLGSKDSKNSRFFGIYRQWKDTTDEDGKTVEVTNYSIGSWGLGSENGYLWFELKSVDKDGNLISETDKPTILYYMTHKSFYNGLDGRMNLGSASYRWNTLYGKYGNFRQSWTEYTASSKTTPGNMPILIHVAPEDNTLTTIEDTASPGIGFATGNKTKKLRGSLILNQDGFKFKDNDNTNYRAIHADSLFLRSTSYGEHSEGNIVFSRVPGENEIKPNYLRLPYAHGQIAICINETISTDKSTLIVDESSIFSGKDNTFDFGKKTYRWRDGYLSGTLYLTNTTDVNPTTKLDTASRNGPALVIGTINGDHLEFDANEIMAKASDTADTTKNKATTLFLNIDGGLVQTGPGGLKTKNSIDVTTDNTANKPVISLFSHIEGTTSATGEARLYIGNASNSTTANNALGRLRIYGSNTGYTDIITGTANTTGYTMYLPGANGQFVYHTNDTKIGSASLPVYIDSTGEAKAIGNLALGSKTSNGASTIRVNRKFSAEGDTNNTSFSFGVTSTGEAGYLQVLRYPDATAESTTSSALYIFSLTGIYPNADNVLTLGLSNKRWNNVYATTFTGNLTGNVTGNADSATKLKNSRDFKIGNTTKSFNGENNVSWTLSEIGAVALDGSTHQIQLTGDSANTSTSGYRLIGTADITTWANRRMLLAVASRHGGNGIIAINYGCNAGTVNAENAYCSIRYFGMDNNDSSGTGLSLGADSFTAYVSSDGKKIYFFWKNSDHNTTKLITLLNQNGFTPTVGDWMTSISATTYGTKLADMKINDNSVYQSKTTASNWRPVLLHYKNGEYDVSPGSVTGTTYYNESIAVRADTGSLRAKQLTTTGDGLYIFKNEKQMARMYNSTLGTAGDGTNKGTLGLTYLMLGNSTANSTATDTAGNSKGLLRLYSDTANWVDLTVVNGLTANKTHYLNATGGRIVTHSSTAATGGTGRPVYISDAGYATGITAVDVAYGGTGVTTLASGELLVGNGTNDVTTRKIQNNTAKGGLGYTATTATYIPTLSTIAYWDGTYNGTSSNLSKLGTITAGTWNGTTIGTGYGGTGNTSFTANTLIYASTATKLSSSNITVSGYTLSSVRTGTDGVSFKVGNDTGTVGIYAGASLGLYDFTNSAWIIYKNVTNNNLNTSLPFIASSTITSYGSLTIGRANNTTDGRLYIRRKADSGTNINGSLSISLTASGQSGQITHNYNNDDDTTKSTSGTFYFNSGSFRPSTNGGPTLGTSGAAWKNIYVTTKGAKSGQALANLGMIYSASEPSTKYEGLVWLCPA